MIQAICDCVESCMQPARICRRRVSRTNLRACQERSESRVKKSAKKKNLYRFFFLNMERETRLSCSFAFNGITDFLFNGFAVSKEIPPASAHSRSNLTRLRLVVLVLVFRQNKKLNPVLD